MEQHEYLDRVCIFCYKTVDKNVQSDDNHVSQNVERFCKFLGRLSSKACKVPVASDRLFEMCADCYKIVDSFNELYHQIQCLQLQLDWRLQKLRNVMKFADKIPSRVKAFRKRYDISIAKQDDSQYKNTIKEIRSQIKSQVIEYDSSVYPRVQLLNNTIRIIPLPNHSQIKEPDENTSCCYNFFIGWVTTFIAVVVCSVPSNTCYNDLAASMSPAAVAPDMSQSPEESKCSMKARPIYEETNISVVTKQGDESVLLSLPASPTEYFEIASPASHVADPCYQSDICGNNDETDQTIEIDPSDLQLVPSQSQLSLPVPYFEHMSLDNSNLIQHTPTSLVADVTSTASDQHPDPTTIYAPSLFNAHFQPQPSSNPIHVQVFNVEPSQQLPDTNISVNTQNGIIIAPVPKSTVDAFCFETEVPSTSRQLRPKFKCDSCSQTFSSLTRLEQHKASCLRQEFNETDEEENATTVTTSPTMIRNNENSEILSHKFESDQDGDQFIKEDSISEVSSMEEEISSDEEVLEVSNKIKKQKNQKTSTQSSRANQIYLNRAFKQSHELAYQTNKTVDELSEIYKNTNGQVDLSEASVKALKLSGTDIRLKDVESSLHVCNIGGCEPSLFSNDHLQCHKRLHGQFECVFCEYTTTYAPTLITHELDHYSNQEEISCPRCSNVKIDKLNYKQHFLKHHLEKGGPLPAAKCFVCTMYYRKEIQVPLSHFVNAHDLSRLNDPETVYVCEEQNCSAYFLTRQQAIAHAHTKHRYKQQFRNGELIERFPFFCDLCPTKFRYMHLLLNHKRALHGGSIVASETGNAKRISLRINLLIEKRNAQYHCPVDNCKRKYFTQEELDIHSKQHGTFKCQFCPVVTTWAYDLAFHELDHGNKTEKGFKCQRCSFSSAWRNVYLVHHLKSHLKLSPDKVNCPHCEKIFDDLGKNYRDYKYWNIYIRRHYTNYHNKCESVEELTEIYKESNGQVELSDENVKLLKITPAQILLNDFKFPLEVCKQEGCEPGLYSSDDLEYHKNLHGNFKCSFCEFRCSFVPTLVSHELEHVSDQPDLSCPKCNEIGKYNMEKIDYKKHVVEQHLEKSVKYRSAKCPICSIPFLKEDQVPLVHFINEHDLSRLKVPEKVEMCNEEGCSAYFLTRKQLISHSNIVHNKTKKFSKGNNNKLVECLHTCEICQMKFTAAHVLARHRLQVHRKRTNEPSIIGNRIISPDGMTVNDFITKRNAKFYCLEENCKEKHFTENERDTHVKLHGSFKCEFCATVVTFAPDLAVHELQHSKSNHSLSSGTSYKCSRCGFCSKFENLYISHHLEKHLNLSSDKVRCQICQMIFRSPNNRNVFDHFRLNHDTSELKDKTAVFNCAHCPAYFLEGHQLELHNIRIHPEQSKVNLSLGCVDCNRQFPNRKFVLDHRLKAHHNNDDSEYQFVCKVTNCQKRFEYKVDLDRHSGWHSTNHFSPKACPECGKFLLGKSSFQNHVRSHRGQVCEQCGKKFRSKGVLAIHLLSHSGPESWEFVCEVCSKKCLSNSKLMEHMRIHTKAKPFICETCGATYAHRHNWRHHMINKHGVKDFTRKVIKRNMTSQKGIKRKRFTAPDPV